MSIDFNEFMDAITERARQLGWQASAVCSQTDPDMFFPEVGVTGDDAKKTCRSCPVQLECLQFALDNEETSGIWGGLSYRDRLKFVRERMTVNRETLDAWFRNFDNKRERGYAERKQWK